MIGLKFKKSNHITKVFLSITFSAFIALGSFSSFVLAQSAEDDEYTRSYNEQKAAEKLANDEYFRKENQQKAAEKLEREESEKKAVLVQTNQAQVLLKKYGKLGPPPDFLVSHFHTWDGTGVLGQYEHSSPIETVIKLYASLSSDHKKSWIKKGNLWIIVVDKRDELTNAKTEVIFAFKDLRKTKGYILLDRILLNGEDISKEILVSTVLNLINRAGL